MALRRSSEEASEALSARDRTRDFPCAGLRVGRLWLDQGFALELHPSLDPAEDGALLRLFTSFAVERAGAVNVFDAGDPSSLAPVFGVLGSHVTSAQMTADAAFRLGLDNGWTLVAGSEDDGVYWDFRQPWNPHF